MTDNQVEVAVVAVVLLVAVGWPLVLLVWRGWDKEQERIPYPGATLDLTGRKLR